MDGCGRTTSWRSDGEGAATHLPERLRQATAVDDDERASGAIEGGTTKAWGHQPRRRSWSGGETPTDTCSAVAAPHESTRCRTPAVCTAVATRGAIARRVTAGSTITAVFATRSEAKSALNAVQHCACSRALTAFDIHTKCKASASSIVRGMRSRGEQSATTRQRGGLPTLPGDAAPAVAP
jgi:hypothetical protein